MARMTTSQSYMRCRGPGVRVRPGRADPLRNWPFLQLIAAACTFLQLWAVGREKRGHFFAANFTSCHVIACICTYIHIIFFENEPPGNYFRMFWRSSANFRLFSLFQPKYIFSEPNEPQRHRRTERPLCPGQSGSFAETANATATGHPWASSLFQGIPAYSNVLFFEYV